MPAFIFCYNCQRQFQVPANTDVCPTCGGGFVEEVQAPPPQQQPAGPAAGGHGGGFSRTFSLPGGGRGTIYVAGPGDMGGGGGGAIPGFGMPGMPGMPAGLGGAAGGDPFVQSVLDALTGGGFLHPGMPPGGGFMGIPMPGGVPPGGWGGHAGGGGQAEQDWLDQVMTQIMQEYQPASQATSRRAVRSLPVLAVRAKEAQGEPGEGEAVARAGEPCSVCHDEFKEGEDVVELPCCHGYHKDCLLPWLETHNTCPVCRHELPAEDPSVETRRRQRAEVVADGGGGGGGSGGGARSVRQRVSAAPAGAGAGGGGGNRLSDLLSNISARWDSFRGDSSSSLSERAGTSGTTTHVSTRVSAGGSGAAATAAAAAGGSQRVQAERVQASASARPPHPAVASGSGSGLRQRRDTAAAAAEARLRGETPPAPPVIAFTQPQPAARPTGVPPRPAAAPSVVPQHPAAARPQPPPPRQEPQGNGNDGVVMAGAVAGGLLGALVGGALMLLGGRRRDRD